MSSDPSTALPGIQPLRGEKERHPVFDISKLYDLCEDWTTKNYPFDTSAGCYVFYTETGTLLYVGQASLNTLGSRLYDHFRRDPRQGIFMRKWSTPPRFLQTICVHEPFEAPSLERYLIRFLGPSDNVLARGCTPEP